MARLTRYYANGSKKSMTLESIKDEFPTVEQWSQFNRANRPGCAQFVDGVCVYDGCGYHNPSDLLKYAEMEKAAITGVPYITSEDSKTKFISAEVTDSK